MTETSSSTAADPFGPAPLVVVREAPFNAESPFTRQVGLLTPVERFYVRSHFEQVDASDAGAWRLEIGGAVGQPTNVDLAILLAMPASVLLTTMECAGNGRQFFSPGVPGEPWSLGAVSTAEWTGVPLARLLERADPAGDAVEVLFVGADRGPSPVDGATIRYERSLSLEQARREDVLLAYAMNGAPLTLAHGAPVRLIVPGWYGMASVKWLRSIEVLRAPFRGAYQTDRYVLDYRDGEAVVPLGFMRPRALIVSPVTDAHLPRSGALIRGYAWSGAAPVDSVEVSVDDGATWQATSVTEGGSRRAWKLWQYEWRPSRSGRHIIQVRAIDATGEAQPAQARWNAHGYANNSIQSIVVDVAE